jgi:hypothetical protein
MKILSRYLFALLLLALMIPSTGSAQKRINTITTAVPFLIIAPDSRGGAMGDAGVATSPDANSIHWNPSKLAFSEKKLGFSLNYTPWLKQLVSDIHLAYLSGYTKIGKDQAVGASLRYFSLGNITFTDNGGNVISDFKPNEFAVDGVYSRKLSKNWSGGLALRYIYSNLTGGINVQGANSKIGQSVAADVSAYYRKPDISMGDKKATFAFGVNISNIGAKISYTETSEKDFLPINLRIGPALTTHLDEYNDLTFTIDFNKLLVPTNPLYDTLPSGAPKIVNGQKVILQGKDPDRPVAAGMLQSFSDAPGGISEELTEITYSIGMEYWYDKLFAFRAGYFYEDPFKGNRKFLTVGAGLKYNVFGIDLSYLVPTGQQSPLGNTLRFTVHFDFDAFKSQNAAPSENP